jgi:hypothetical protein
MAGGGRMFAQANGTAERRTSKIMLMARSKRPANPHDP